MSQPEVITVNSEALEATIRDLLPSQRGFGSELQASNVILPIIDLTPTAEGSALASDLARAINFGGATTFATNNTTETPASGLGFYRVKGVSNHFLQSSGAGGNEIIINDGSTDKIIMSFTGTTNTTGNYIGIPFDFVVFLRSQDSLITKSTTARQTIQGSVRQIADGNGTTITPTGFEVE